MINFKKIISIWTLIYCSCMHQAYSIPDRLELWFISPDPAITFLKLKLPEEYSFYQNITQANLHSQCTPMGELFFHPQYGLHDHGGHKLNSGKTTLIEVPKKNKKDKFLSDEDVQLINCDKNYYFDLYCGKTKKGGSSLKSGLEIWVDTSSSLRTADPTINGTCYRKSFIQRLFQECSKYRPNISVFDTSKKQLGSFNTLCNNQGLNDQNRLKKWINNSKAKVLIIITDISELEVQLIDYIESVNGILVGHNPQDALLAKDMVKKVPTLKPYCQKLNQRLK